jgi:predicted nucleotidyltransferase
MSQAERLKSKRKDILRLAKRYGASNLRVFGSVARGEANSNSDIDLLVELEPGREACLTWVACLSNWKTCLSARLICSLKNRCTGIFVTKF